MRISPLVRFSALRIASTILFSSSGVKKCSFFLKEKIDKVCIYLMFSLIEFHLRRFFRASLSCEISLFFETENSGKDIIRESLYSSVVFLNGGIEIITGYFDPV